MGSRLRGQRVTALIAAILIGVLVISPLLTLGVSAAPASVDPSNTVLNWAATSPAGADVTLDASASSDDITAFAWYEGETLLAEGEIVSVLLAIGSHEITLQATDGIDTVAADPITVTVTDGPAVANAGADQTLDATGDLTTVTLDGSASTGAASYTWSVGGTDVAGAVATVDLPVGVTEATLTVTSAGGTSTSSDTMTVTINPVAAETPETSVVDDTKANPGATQLDWDATSDAGADVTLDGTLSSDAADQYAWRENCAALPCAAETLLAETETATVPLAIGEHSITLFVHVAGAWYASTPITVTVNPAEDVVIAAPPAASLDPTSGTVNSTVDYQIALFPANVEVAIELTRAGSNPIALGTVTTDASGGATGSFVVPATPGGAVQIRFTWGTAVAVADFQVVPRIKVTPSTVEPGDTVDVSLRGFGKNELVNIRWLINGTWVQVASVTTSNSGSANVNVVVPANVATGPNSVRGDGSLFSAQTNAVTVVNAIIPEVSVDPTRGIVGSTVNYQIAQFPASSSVTIQLVRAGSNPIALGTATTNATGSASGSFVVPAAPGGNVQIRFTSGTTVLNAAFEIAPRILVIPSTVDQGQTANVSLRGFGKNELVRIRWLVNGSWVQVATVTTSNSGSANVNVVVPENAAEGQNSVRGDGTTFRAQTNAVFVNAVADPAVQIVPTRGTVGTGVGYTLAYFPASSTVNIVWHRPGGSTVAVGTATTDASGSASGTIVVPATTGGANLISFTSGSEVVTVSYEVAPRIQVAPSTVSRGQAVSVSLRGFGKNETVRIRWLVNGSWVQVATVVTSNTGSANLTVNVPANANLGPNSVRGDGTTFRAQTNAVTVV